MEVNLVDGGASAMVAQQRWPEGKTMPRYVFNASSGICFVQEFEIYHLPDLETARHEAHRVARHFRAYLPRHLRQESLTVEIVEETGQELAILRLEPPF
ncbi:hypothetical protein AA309_21595 [Microvirga vignae]|uniref:DUF6894 domain-containing protein n=1 Tax=Microvirga vignae TaxID=1225564 RepID=A0A0H1REZ3_9HYPH|nr:hypothetical protein AA309_21595 [Microvirga vignae]